MLYKQKGNSTGTLYSTSKRYIELPLRRDGEYVVEVRAHTEGGDGTVAQIDITGDSQIFFELTEIRFRYFGFQVQFSSLQETCIIFLIVFVKGR